MQDFSGLSSGQIDSLRSQYGFNELAPIQKVRLVVRFAQQFASVLILLLFIAAVVAFFVGETVDALFIFAIIILNGILGFYQEFKAEKAVEALHSMTVSTVRAIRDGSEIELPSRELVVGDIVLLDEGTRIPADGIVRKSVSLDVNESSLTGESVGVSKVAHSETQTPDDSHRVFLGTEVSRGHGVMEVTAIGMHTRFGKITETMQAIKAEPTPLQRNLSSLGKMLSFIAAVICILLFVIGYLRGFDILTLFLTSVSLAVAAIPEGLPAIVTITLGLGVSTLAARHAIVRKLSSIETLGSTQVICTDKTGTLTTNDMRVRTFETFDTSISHEEIIKAVSLCNTANIITHPDATRHVAGDTTEGALLYWVEKEGGDYQAIRSEKGIVLEIPFDSAKKYMAVVVDEHNHFVVYCKGAPEVLLGISDVPVTVHSHIEDSINRFAQDGLRTIAVGIKRIERDNLIIDSDHEDELLNGLSLVGLFGIADPPRAEVTDAIAKARVAGVETVMITGDNAITARAIAHEIGLLRDGDEVWSGDQVREASDESLLSHLDRVRVFSRTSPEDKFRIVSLLQKKGYIVAATGDGVNDSLAIKKADIGISMSITGTDVAKEASDMILVDDNYSTIVSAIEEGRRIYQNIVKAVHYLLACNLSEIVFISLSIILFETDHLPLIPVQVLWINLVTDGLPALALATDPLRPTAMREPPRKKHAGIIQRSDFLMLGSITLACSLVSIGAYWIGMNMGGYLVARTFAFNALVIMQCISLLAIRRMSPFSNMKLLLIVVGTIVLQIAVTNIPFTQDLFQLR